MDDYYNNVHVRGQTLFVFPETNLANHGDEEKSGDSDDVTSGMATSNHCPHSRFSLARQVRRLSNALFAHKEEEIDLEDLDLNIGRYRPESIEKLVRTTNFTRNELKMMYRGFKQVPMNCPKGIVSFSQFKEIYTQFFPTGDSSKYAFYVFNTFDTDRDGNISFEEFVTGLSVLSRGSEQEKIEWIFHLYDIGERGYITNADMAEIIGAVYDLLGKKTHPPIEQTTVAEHVSEMFKIMDANQDGIITEEEFMQACKANDWICEQLGRFGTVM